MSKSMLSQAVWNIGTNGTETSYNNMLTAKFHELERSGNTGKNCTSSDGTWCSDTVKRTTKWPGYIGLIFSSDYGYAISGGMTTSRNKCLNTILTSWIASNVSDCKMNNWLYKNGMAQCSISPLLHSNPEADTIFCINRSGRVEAWNTYYHTIILPTIYLTSNVKITFGNGTELNPFNLRIE